ncbi:MULTISPECIES: extracellular solute-binding protein [Sinorhizobium]|nr:MULTISPECIES: extracellular solute-binding protein [Sinorhizobium]ASY60658.1 Glucosamine ABC transport system, periplasmic sugar-binding protein [Sinorhizobium sp. CCBAU 05631]ASY74168.1 Glucosamine ABC transport system, periplasmic sugar-binding protein [Sinorhizobium fredii CCBAU 83666]
MKRLLAWAMMLTGVMATQVSAADVKLKALFIAQAAYNEQSVREMTDEFQKQNPSISVDLEFVPYEGLHDKIVLAQGSGDGYDAVLFDVIWPAEFAVNDILVDVTDRITPEMNAGVLPGAWTTVEYKGQRYGMPWVLDTKYLFYNKEMLAKAGFDTPPKTWAELMNQAKAIKEKGIVQHPIVWSWAQAEAVICDYGTLLSAFGGKFLDEKGAPAFQSDGGLKALDYMAASIKDGATNPNSREYLEEDVRRVFQDGEAAFALNWTYMFNLANDPKQSKVAGKVGVVAAPGVEGISTASAVNGSMGLGITKSSQHPEETWKYITFLTSQPTQNKFAKLSLPIWASSYDDPAVVEGQQEMVAAAKIGLPLMYPRPAAVKYQELSLLLQVAIQRALFDQASPDEALIEAASSYQP